MPSLAGISAINRPHSTIDIMAPANVGCFNEPISAPGRRRFNLGELCLQFLIQFKQNLQSLLSDKNCRCRYIGQCPAFSDPLKQSCVVHIVLHVCLFARISSIEDMLKSPFNPPNGHRWRHHADFSKIRSKTIVPIKTPRIK